MGHSPGKKPPIFESRQERERTHPRNGEHEEAQHKSLEAFFHQAIDCLNSLDIRFENEESQLESLKNRLTEGKLHLAVLGQFKRGKSTFLNALLGDSLLPSSVLPLTAIPTFLYAGPSLKAEALGNDGVVMDRSEGDDVESIHAFLSRMVTEEANPKNRLGISHVHVFSPSPLLQKGVVLIDTPGIGSTFIHNTEVTLNFLPQCDAAIFLISADPPISEVELEFLKRVQTRVPRLFFILNKVDYLSEKERSDAIRFFQSILHEKAGIDEATKIFTVSSKKGLEARHESDSFQWTESGMADVEDHLIAFLAREKSEVLRKAVSSKACDALSNVMMQLDILLRSLRMPLSELESRQRLFESKIKEAEHQKLISNDLLNGERQRLTEFLEQQAEGLRKKGEAYFDQVLEEILKKNHTIDESREILLNALPVFFERELGELSVVFHERVSQALRPHQGRADELIESIRKAAADLFEIPYHAPESSDAFEMKRQPFWSTQQRQSFMNPIPEGILYQLLPGGIRLKRMKKHLKKEMDHLIFQNVENLRWVTLQNLNQAFRRFSLKLSEELGNTITAIHRAIQEAVRKRQEQSDRVADEITRYETANANIAEIVKSLSMG